MDTHKFIENNITQSENLIDIFSVDTLYYFGYIQINPQHISYIYNDRICHVQVGVNVLDEFLFFMFGKKRVFFEKKINYNREYFLNYIKKKYWKNVIPVIFMEDNGQRFLDEEWQDVVMINGEYEIDYLRFQYVPFNFINLSNKTEIIIPIFK